MTTIQMPTLSYPFSSGLNQHVHEAQQHIVSWVTSHGLITTEPAHRRFEKARFAWLAARAFPDAGLHELCIIADFNTWLFILDDQCDEATVGRKADFLRSMMGGLMDILHHNRQVAPETGGPVSAALSSIWERMRAISSPSWRLRFIRSMDDYFTSCIWEAENREAGITPSVAEYVHMRPFTGALLADIEAIEIIEKIYLSREVVEQPLVQRMIQACNNIVCWANDLFSCTKEARQGDVHNLVLVLQHARQCTLQEAINEAARMHNEEVAIFIALEKLLPLKGAEADYELLRYISVLRSWITGNYDWSVKDTGRYGIAVGDVVAA